MRERERLEREADHRRQVFADSVRDGRQMLAPMALLDGAVGILAHESPFPWAPSGGDPAQPGGACIGIGSAGVCRFFHTLEQKAHVG